MCGKMTGGTSVASPSVLSDVSTIQIKGPTNRQAPMISTAWVRATAIIRACLAPPLTWLPALITCLCIPYPPLHVMDPPTLQAHLHQGNSENDDKQQHRNCRSVSLVIEYKSVFIEEVDNRLCRFDCQVCRHSADCAKHQENQIEDLKGRDQRNYARKENGGREQRQRDAPEAAPGIGPIDLRRLIVCAGNTLQTGQKQHHIVANRAPDGNQRQRI